VKEHRPLSDAYNSVAERFSLSACAITGNLNISCDDDADEALTFPSEYTILEFTLEAFRCPRFAWRSWNDVARAKLLANSRWLIHFSEASEENCRDLQISNHYNCTLWMKGDILVTYIFSHAVIAKRTNKYFLYTKNLYNCSCSKVHEYRGANYPKK